MRFLTLSGIAFVAVSATPLAQWHGTGPWGHGHGNKHAAKAAYFLDDDPSGSSIVSLTISGDGLLSDPVKTSTNGYGSIGVNLTGFPNPSDALMSQGAVVVSGDLLFTVNAGSNTLAMFRIEPSDPSHPTLVGTADTMGEFPMSVTYSEALQMVCVLNGGAISGVGCFEVDPAKGLIPAGSLRSLAGHLNETTPPSGPPGSAGQIIFDPSSRGVFALLKGNAGATPPLVGTIVGFAVQNGSVLSTPIITQIGDLLMDFSASWLSEDHMLMTDPSFGVALLELGADLTFTELAHTVISKQKAICWSNVDFSLGFAYAIDAGRNQMYKININTGAHEGNIHVTGDGNLANKGIFDSAIDSDTNLMYSLIGGNGVIVTDLKAEKQVQFLDLSSFDSRQYYQGMAVFPSSN